MESVHIIMQKRVALAEARLVLFADGPFGVGVVGGVRHIVELNAAAQVSGFVFEFNHVLRVAEFHTVAAQLLAALCFLFLLALAVCFAAGNFLIAQVWLLVGVVASAMNPAH